ncbi:triose-phosphate isomerase, partial [Chlamydia psittaci 08-2626_L3]
MNELTNRGRRWNV